MTTDNAYMQRCFALAERGRNTSHPNPVVGCLIVSEGKVVGEGWHQLAGHAHAEGHGRQVDVQRDGGGERIGERGAEEGAAGDAGRLRCVSSKPSRANSCSG